MVDILEIIMLFTWENKMRCDELIPELMGLMP